MGPRKKLVNAIKEYQLRAAHANDNNNAKMNMNEYELLNEEFKRRDSLVRFIIYYIYLLCYL
jgi:hypothetical protein